MGDPADPLVCAAADVPAADVPEDVPPAPVEASLPALGSVAVLVVSVPVALVSPGAAGAAELPASVVVVVSAGAEASDVGAAEVVDGAELPPELAGDVDDAVELAPDVPAGGWLAVDEGLVPGSAPDAVG